MTIAYVGLGSNVGDRTAFVRQAVEALEGTEGIVIRKVSSLYETEPIGGPPQRSFINVAVEIDTDLDAHSLLKACKSIEQRLGREPSDIKWGPRTVDLDVLLYDDEKISDPELEVPHPRMAERRFVLVPLLEIAPDVADPWGSRYADVLDEARGDVQLLEPF